MFAGGRIGGNSVCESRLQVKGRGFVYRSINEKWESYVSVGGVGGVGTYAACRLQNYQPDYQPDYQLRADGSNYKLA